MVERDKCMRGRTGFVSERGCGTEGLTNASNKLHTRGIEGQKNDLGKVLRPNYPNGPGGLVFLLLFEKKGKKLVWSKTIASHVRLIRPSRRTRFAGPIERYFSHGPMRRRSTEIYIYNIFVCVCIIQDRKRQIESFIPMTHTPRLYYRR